MATCVGTYRMQRWVVRIEVLSDTTRNIGVSVIPTKMDAQYIGSVVLRVHIAKKVLLQRGFLRVGH